MNDTDLSDDLRQLLDEHIATMDHVAVLVTLHAHQQDALTPGAIGDNCRLTPDVVERILRDLVSSHLIMKEHGVFRYNPAAGDREAVNQLAEMNRTRPVSLVKAIYARPSRAAQSFANAFRLRKHGE